MKEIPRESPNGTGLLLIKRIPGLNSEPVAGYNEEWHSDENDWNGISTSRDNIINAYHLAMGHGIYLGSILFVGFPCECKFYNVQSFLVNGSILSYGDRREEFGNNGTELHVSERMPELILRIISETEDRLRDTAEKLKLPLEVLAQVPI